MVSNMRTVSIKLAEDGDKFFECAVCMEKAEYVEISSGCCVNCISTWAEVCKHMQKEKDGIKK